MRTPATIISRWWRHSQVASRASHLRNAYGNEWKWVKKEGNLRPDLAAFNLVRVSKICLALPIMHKHPWKRIMIPTCTSFWQMKCWHKLCSNYRFGDDRLVSREDTYRHTYRLFIAPRSFFSNDLHTQLSPLIRPLSTCINTYIEWMILKYTFFCIAIGKTCNLMRFKYTYLSFAEMLFFRFWDFQQICGQTCGWYVSAAHV